MQQMSQQVKGTDKKLTDTDNGQWLPERRGLVVSEGWKRSNVGRKDI